MAFKPMGGGRSSESFRPLQSREGRDEHFQPGPGSRSLVAELADATVAEPALTPADLEALLDQARAEGAAQERARVEGELGQLRNQGRALAEAVEQVRGLRRQILTEVTEEVGELVCRLTQRVLGQSIALHPEALPTLLARALERFPDQEGLSIRVPPGAMEALREVVSPEVGAALVEDPTVQQGVVVSSRRGEVESTLASAMEAIEEAVRAWQEASSC